ncbi:M56 family metallopeptidase [Oscillospiraceae bacterium 50-60]
MSLLQMSFAGAVMIFAITLIRALAISLLPKKTFLALWGIAVVRLLLPFSLPSMFSVYSLTGNQTFGIATAKVPQIDKVLPIDTSGQMAAMPVNVGNTASIISLWGAVWAAGVLVCAVVFAIAYWKCRQEFQTSLPVKNDFIKSWLDTHQQKRPISIRQSSRFSTPLTYGVFRPVILLPTSTDWENTEALQYVLAHEYVHIRRFDSITKLVLIVALCVHWFNPLVWVMYILANRDIELSCDEAVVRLFGETTKAAYARVLISMEETRSGLNPLSSNFSKSAIEERITAIMKIKKSSVLSFALALALVVCVTTAFATSAATKNNNSLSVPSIIYRDDATNKTSESALGAEDGYQALLALKSADYHNQTVADFDKALLDWGNQHPEEHEDIIQNDIAAYCFPTYLTAEEKNFLALTIRASNIENSLLVKSSYGSPVIDPDLSFELARESQETDPPTWVSLMYGVSYHLDPQVVTVVERDTALANAINDIQSFWYDTNLETLAEMSSGEVLFKLNAIADNNSTNAIQLSIVKNYYIFQASPMFD